MVGVCLCKYRQSLTKIDWNRINSEWSVITRAFCTWIVNFGEQKNAAIFKFRFKPSNRIIIALANGNECRAAQSSAHRTAQRSKWEDIFIIRRLNLVSSTSSNPFFLMRPASFQYVTVYWFTVLHMCKQPLYLSGFLFVHCICLSWNSNWNCKRGTHTFGSITWRDVNESLKFSGAFGYLLLRLFNLLKYSKSERALYSCPASMPST